MSRSAFVFGFCVGRGGDVVTVWRVGWGYIRWVGMALCGILFNPNITSFSAITIIYPYFDFYARDSNVTHLHHNEDGANHTHHNNHPLNNFISTPSLYVLHHAVIHLRLLNKLKEAAPEHLQPSKMYVYSQAPNLSNVSHC